MEQVRLRKVQIANGEVAKCVAVLSNRLSVIKAVDSTVARSSELKIRNETSGDSVDRRAESGAGPRNVLLPVVGIHVD